VTAAAVVLDARRDGEPLVLLLGHQFRPGRAWGVPGGFLQPGENPEDAIRRELREEIGLEIASARLVSARTLSKYRQVELLFLCQPLGDGSPKGFEISRVSWFPLDSLPESLSEDQRSLIRRALDERNR
jgi:ADP-ribose pyrophosphatase YjhB (NUDIX family)